jgi:signal transduction histidine kinase
MTRSLAAVAVAAALVFGIVAPVYGGHDALLTSALVAAVSAGGLAVAHVVAAQRRGWSLRRRFAIAIVTAVAVVIATVLAGAELMFVSDHDALMISAIVLAAAVVALRAARVTSEQVVDEVGQIRDALRAVGEGSRSARVDAVAAAELAELAAAVTIMTEQLAHEEARRDAAESARRNLVAAASHDLRTPMTALRLLTEAIEDDIVDEATRRRYLATMRTHLAALGALIDDLFELSRLEAGDLEWSIQRVALRDLVDEAVEAMRVEAEAKGVAVRAELPPTLGFARADPERLQRVLFNLIQNAIRHTPADGSVTVRANDSGDWVEIEVADTGEGIPAAQRDVVFDPFVRGDDARSGEGAGLGLAISRAIVEGHGGRIWVDAGAGSGTHVRFVIPA